MTAPTTQTDIVTYLTEQHREVEQMFGQLESMSGSTDDEARRIAEQVVTTLVQHSVAEEIHLYPATRDHVPGGNDIADHEVEEHQGAEQKMKKLESLSPEDGEFWPTLRELMDEIRHHVSEEENDLFPKLRQACTEERLQELAVKAQEAEAKAPTRPHPSSPSEGGALAAVAPGAGMVDRLRDRLSGRGR